MAYLPTVQDSLDAYIAAVAHHYTLPSSAIDWPSLGDVREVVPGSFSIRAQHGAGPDQQLDDLALALYDEENDLWIVRLEDGVIVALRKTSGEGSSVFVVE